MSLLVAASAVRAASGSPSSHLFPLVFGLPSTVTMAARFYLPPVRFPLCGRIAPMVGPARHESICEEKARLTESFHQACRELMSLHDREIAALVAGTPLQRSDLAIKRAQQKREETKRALLRHTTSHGCD